MILAAVCAVMFFAGVSLFRWLGFDQDWSAGLVAGGMTAWLFAWALLSMKKLNGMSNRIGKSVLGIVALAFAVLLSGFVAAHFMAGRYESRTVGNSIYVVDRLTGVVKRCTARDCKTVEMERPTIDTATADDPFAALIPREPGSR